MACRGVHFALTSAEAEELGSTGSDEELLALISKIEEKWDVELLAESDKAWDAMHRCLSDGQLNFGGGSYPLSHCILGPRQLHKGEDYIVSLVLAKEVQDLAGALEGISKASFAEKYRTMVPDDYAPEYGPEDLEYTWENFEPVRALFMAAAKRQMAVIFTVDQ